MFQNSIHKKMDTPKQVPTSQQQKAVNPVIPVQNVHSVQERRQNITVLLYINLWALLSYQFHEKYTTRNKNSPQWAIFRYIQH
jgi:hypothetical protein